MHSCCEMLKGLVSCKQHSLQAAATPGMHRAAGVRPFSSFGKIGSLLGLISAAAAALPLQPAVPLHLPLAAAVQSPLIPRSLPLAWDDAGATPPPQSQGSPLLGHTILLLPPLMLLPFVLLPLTAPLALPLGLPPFSSAVAAAMPWAAAIASRV
jgi:hypothetical protein